MAALLVRAKQTGYSFVHTATIGRQSLAVPVRDLARLARRLGIAEPNWAEFAKDGFCEDFLRLFLGAETISSFDASDYQNATVIHDFNVPLPDQYHGTFDAVIDGGTIEHIFDIKQVLRNYMALVKIGGHVHICTSANNLCGHGFYQFSPEFFSMVFDETNGFEVNDICLIETPLHFIEKSRHQRVFKTIDFASVRKRMVIVTDRPVSIYVHASRVSNKPLFVELPCQREYLPKSHAKRSVQIECEPGSVSREKKYRFQYVSFWEELRRSRLQKRKNSLGNRRWFKPLVP